VPKCTHGCFWAIKTSKRSMIISFSETILLARANHKDFCNVSLQGIPQNSYHLLTMCCWQVSAAPAVQLIFNREYDQSSFHKKYPNNNQNPLNYYYILTAQVLSLRPKWGLLTQEQWQELRLPWPGGVKWLPFLGVFQWPGQFVTQDGCWEHLWGLDEWPQGKKALSTKLKKVEGG